MKIKHIIMLILLMICNINYASDELSSYIDSEISDKIEELEIRFPILVLSYTGTNTILWSFAHNFEEFREIYRNEEFISFKINDVKPTTTNNIRLRELKIFANELLGDMSE